MGTRTAHPIYLIFLPIKPNLIMNTAQEIDLMKSAVSNNIWVHRNPAVKEHLISVLSEIRKKYFADDIDKGNAFNADILTDHNELYTESLPCIHLRDKKALVEHQEAIKHFRTIDRYLENDGDIEFKLQGWEQGGTQGVNVASIRVWNKGHSKSELWNTRELSHLPDKLGFNEIGYIVTEVQQGSPRYNAIREALRSELSQGWTGKGNATYMAPVRAFAELCKPLDAKIKEHLPDSTNVERARIILRLFDIDADDADFSELLNKQS